MAAATRIKGKFNCRSISIACEMFERAIIGLTASPINNRLAKTATQMNWLQLESVYSDYFLSE